MNDVVPLEALERVLKNWWLVALVAVLGGLAGWMASNSLPPVYEAHAVYSVELNELELAHRIGIPVKDLPLLYPTKEPYLLAVQTIFYAEDTVSDLLEVAAAQGSSLRREDFNSRSFYLARHGQLWFATVRLADPLAAAELANAWVEAADARLNEAQTHTMNSMALQAQRSAVLKCFEQFDFEQANQCAGTDFKDPEALTSNLEMLAEQASAEQELGLKIDSALRFDFTEKAGVPALPVLYNASSLGLAGLLVGFLLGAVFVQTWPGRDRPARKA